MGTAIWVHVIVGLTVGELSRVGEPGRTWDFDLNVQNQVTDEDGRSKVICSETHGHLAGDGTWLLRINVVGDGSLIELAGDGSTSVETIRETINAALHRTAPPEPPTTPD